MNEERYWLIERSDGPWWWSSIGGVWTRDASDAVRFCRRQDAARTLEWLERRSLVHFVPDWERGERWTVTVTEHMDTLPPEPRS